MSVAMLPKPQPAPPVPLVEVICPICKPHKKRVLIRAAKGSVVEAYCRHCKYRAIVVVS